MADETPTTSDYLSVLKMHVDVANGEKQAIWNRHATMVVGNSLIINAARADTAALNAGSTLFLNALGLCLCVVWIFMTWHGWGWFRHSISKAKNIPINPALNPFGSYPEIYQRRKDLIFICALLVVLAFASMYVVGLWPAIRSIIAFICGK